MLKIGVTGGLGSGKSTVTRAFARLAVPVIDTDEISRGLTAPAGLALPTIREAFGDGVFDADGTLHRQALRALILKDASAKERLEAIIHPLIYQETIRQLDAVHAPYVLIVVPLLIETGVYQALVDRVLVVDCSEELQVARALARGGWDEAEIRSMLARQASRQQRLARADDVIDNGGTLAELDRQVVALHAKYRELAEERL
jgi:dephospho-CoA kinase